MSPVDEARRAAKELERLAIVRGLVETPLEKHNWRLEFWRRAQTWRKACDAVDASRAPHPDSILQAYGEGANI